MKDSKSDILFNEVVGMRTRFPEDVFLWNYILDTARSLFNQISAAEIHTPIVENAHLFQSTIGESSDIVRFELFKINIFDENLVLRPELTTPIIRSVLKKTDLYLGHSRRYWSFGPTFRAEAPSEGRLRQFHQLTFEHIGAASYIADIEAIQIAYKFLCSLGVIDPVVHISSVGNKTDRENYNKYLNEILSEYKHRLSSNSIELLKINALRILDSKDQKDIDLIKEIQIKPLLEYVNNDSVARLDFTIEKLQDLGVNCVLDSSIVRGVDIYNDVAFEIKSPTLDLTLIGGGRYDKLSEHFGYDQIPAVGWGCGIERLIVGLDSLKTAKLEQKNTIVVFCETSLQYIAYKQLNIFSNNYNVDFQPDLEYHDIKPTKNILYLEIKRDSYVLHTTFGQSVSGTVYEILAQTKEIFEVD